MTPMTPNSKAVYPEQYAQGLGEPFPFRRGAHGGPREPAEGGPLPCRGGRPKIRRGTLSRFANPGIVSRERKDERARRFPSTCFENPLELKPVLVTLVSYVLINPDIPCMDLVIRSREFTWIYFRYPSHDL